MGALLIGLTKYVAPHNAESTHLRLRNQISCSVHTSSVGDAAMIVDTYGVSQNPQESPLHFAPRRLSSGKPGLIVGQQYKTQKLSVTQGTVSLLVG